MNGPRDKKIHVGRFDYTINEDAGQDVAAIVAAIRAALTGKSVVEVPVLDENRNRLTLFINGAEVEALALDLGGPPKPGELSP